MDILDENSIVNRVLGGDDGAFERLIDRYENKVYQYALRFLGQESDACVATEEIFYQMYRKLDSCADARLSNWVFRIAANVCAEQQHRKRGAKGAALSDAVFRLRDCHRDARDLDGEIQAQLLRLTRQQREVLLLRDLCGLNDEETGVVLGLEETGVRQRLSRARKNLRDLLLRQGALEPPPQGSGDCRRYRELCSQYVDGCIADADRAGLLDHIQECGTCAAYLGDLTAIGRSLSHMAEEPAPPEQLREKIITAVQRQAERVGHSRRRGYRQPIAMILTTAVVFLALISSGVLGGLFVNTSDAACVPGDGAHAEVPGSAAMNEALDRLDVPDAVAANSYAFVIAAAGETDLPELSTSATLLAGDTRNRVEYYTVGNDLGLVQKLTEGLESVGYQMQTVSSGRLVISSDASRGLFIVIHRGS